MFVSPESITAKLSDYDDLVHNIPAELPYWGFRITINLEPWELRAERAMAHLALLADAWEAMSHGTLSINGTDAQIRKILRVTDLAADFHGTPDRDDFTKTHRRITPGGKGRSSVSYQKFRSAAA